MADTRYYIIRVQAILDPSWAEWFDGMTITPDMDRAETVLCGAVPDQAALHGLLNRILDLNLTLIALQRRSSNQLPHIPTQTNQL